MVVHKRTKLTPILREAIYNDYHHNRIRVCNLMRKYHVTAPTIYRVLKRGRVKDFSVHKSINHRYRCLKWGIKRLSKIEAEIEERLKNQAKRYNKDYPGQMIHFDSKLLPHLEGQSTQSPQEYLFVAVDDFSRELLASIKPDRTQYSAKAFLEQVLEECAYTVEQAYSDNGTEFKGDPENHEFMRLCKERKIEQRFTKVRNPKTNGKAERVIRTVMQMWHDRHRFMTPAHRSTELIRFVNYYNSVKPHASIGGLTPMEKLLDYFFPVSL
jgi:transposase InsO family protein